MLFMDKTGSIELPGGIRLKFKPEVAISHDPATVSVFQGDKLVAKIRAKIEREKGGDGGHYPVVKFEAEEIPG